MTSASKRHRGKIESCERVGGLAEVHTHQRRVNAMLAGIGAFTAQNLKFAIHQFCQFENANRRDVPKSPTHLVQGWVGGWDTLLESDHDLLVSAGEGTL